MVDQSKKPDFDRPAIETRASKLPWVVVGSSFAMFLILAGFMYHAGLFDAPNDTVEADTLAAVLTLLGVLLTQLLVGAGLLLKHSFDVRTHRLAVFEQQRLAVDAERAEQHKTIEQERLREDTVLRAVELLSDGSGEKNASPARQVGAIRALASLGEMELAVSLLDMLWSDPITPRLPVLGALSLVDYVFSHESDTYELRQEAAAILQFNAPKLFSADDILLPRVIKNHGWTELPPPIALHLVLAVAYGSASSFPSLDPAPSKNVRYVLSRLYQFSAHSGDRLNQLIAAHTALELARSLPPTDSIMVGQDTLSPDALETRLREIAAGDEIPEAAKEWVLKLRRWADGLVLAR